MNRYRIMGLALTALTTLSITPAFASSGAENNDDCKPPTCKCNGTSNPACTTASSIPVPSPTPTAAATSDKGTVLDVSRGTTTTASPTPTSTAK